MTKWIWLLIIGLVLWIGIIGGQQITLHRFNTEIERLSDENGYLNSRIRNLKAVLDRQEAEITILKSKIKRR